MISFLVIQEIGRPSRGYVGILHAQRPLCSAREPLSAIVAFYAPARTRIAVGDCSLLQSRPKNPPQPQQETTARNESCWFDYHFPPPSSKILETKKHLFAVIYHGRSSCKKELVFPTPQDIASRHCAQSSCGDAAHSANRCRVLTLPPAEPDPETRKKRLTLVFPKPKLENQKSCNKRNSL